MTALSGKLREQKGKSASRKLRRENQLPAVLYGLKDNLSLLINPKELGKIMVEQGKNALIDLSIDGDSQKQRKVILKDYQDHPIKEGWLHVDFFEIDLKKKIKVHAPVVLKGRSPGEKLGGLVNHVLRFIDVECLPDDIPDSVEVDMENVQLGQVVHVSDLAVPDNVKYLNQPGDAVVSVYIEKVKEEEEEKPPEEGEAAVDEKAEGETPSAEESDKKEKEGK
ncbi:MAG: 50S ribosomal protein L25 [Nitrospinaceae bacterium]